MKELSPGYKEFEIAPKLGGKLTLASAELTTVYGLAKSSWAIDDGNFKFDIIVPANTTARVTLPLAGSKKVTERSTDVNKVKVLKDILRVGDDLTLTLGSGTYHFEYMLK